MKHLATFGRFWYDFIIGDDWTVAAGVVIALAVVAVVSRTSIPAWWIVPVAVAILLPMSVWRVTRTLRHEGSTT